MWLNLWLNGFFFYVRVFWVFGFDSCELFDLFWYRGKVGLVFRDLSLFFRYLSCKKSLVCIR